MRAYYLSEKNGTPRIIVEIIRIIDEARYEKQKPLVSSKRLPGTGELVVIRYDEVNTPVISCGECYIDVVVPRVKRFREAQKTLNGRRYSFESDEERFSQSRFKTRELEFVIKEKD